MYNNQRETYRQTFFTTWQKYQKGESLSSVEQQILAVILEHPEYHALLQQEAPYQQQEFLLHENPFIHMSLHLAIRDQIHLDRPVGIKMIFQTLLSKYSDQMVVEHLMLDCLAEILWSAQQQSQPADEVIYLNRLKQLC